MTLSLNATVTNNTKSTLTFQSQLAVHGTNPLASPTILQNGQASLVTAVPNDTVLGPSPEGTFEWLIPGVSQPFLIAYDLHDSPVSIKPMAVPSGYAVTQCSINSSGVAIVVLAQS
jgi:hypothetical protein